MQTDFPTVELYFIFAFTYCKLRVYKKQEAFARLVLEAHHEEFLEPSHRESWHEFDTRILLDLVGQALTKTLPKIHMQPDEVTRLVTTALGIQR